MRTLAALLLLPACLMLSVCLTLAPAHASAPPDNPLPTPADFSCAGAAHAEAVGLWEHSLRNYFAREMVGNLDRGNVYILYYTQEELQSFVEMTRRCKDSQQIAELVDVLTPAFAALRPLPDAPGTLGWVCTGGSYCTAANHLLGNEVQLDSAQFLGLLGALATDIVETVPASEQTAAEKSFVTNAATAMATQVDNWLSPAYFQHVAARAAMTPADARDGKSVYFFEDRDLWFMTTLSDLAELHVSGVRLSGAGAQAFASLRAKHRQIAGLFDLFLARVTLFDGPDGRRAEIDRGYWKSYGDSRYASYVGRDSPAQCATGAQSQPPRIDPNLGWDISHARRLVPALATFARNRANLATVFGYRNPAFDPAALQRAFANQIVERIWNKNPQFPLFSNFWDGHNGWYRVGYKGAAGVCQAGVAPYGMTWSFPTGGYPGWGRFNATLQSLNQRLFALLDTNDPRATAFFDKFYPQLGAANTPPANHGIWRLTFLSSLVDS